MQFWMENPIKYKKNKIKDILLCFTFYNEKILANIFLKNLINTIRFLHVIALFVPTRSKNSKIYLVLTSNPKFRLSQTLLTIWLVKRMDLHLCFLSLCLLPEQLSNSTSSYPKQNRTIKLKAWTWQTSIYFASPMHVVFLNCLRYRVRNS